MRQERGVEPEHFLEEKLPVPALGCRKQRDERLHLGVPVFVCNQRFEIFWIKISARAGSNCLPLHRSIS